MSPAPTTPDVRDVIQADPVVGGDLASRPWVSTDGFDLQRTQPGARVVLSVLRSTATLGGAVPVVVALGPEEQVVDVDARRVVATMKNAHAFGNGATLPRPGETMGLPSDAVDSLTDVATGATVSNGFDTRSHGFNPTFGGQ